LTKKRVFSPFAAASQIVEARAKSCEKSLWDAPLPLFWSVFPSSLAVFPSSVFILIFQWWCLGDPFPAKPLGGFPTPGIGKSFLTLPLGRMQTPLFPFYVIIQGMGVFFLCFLLYCFFHRFWEESAFSSSFPSTRRDQVSLLLFFGPLPPFLR